MKHPSAQAHACQARACQALAGARNPARAQARVQARAWARAPEQASRTLMNRIAKIKQCLMFGEHGNNKEAVQI